MLDQITAWLSAHPFLATLVWPIVTALVTTLFHWAETSKVPLIGTVVTVLKAIGVDGPKVISWLQSLFTPKPPSAPPVLPSVGKIGIQGAGLALCAMIFAGCVDGKPSPATQAVGQEVLSVAQVLCIIGHVTEPSSDAVAEACAIESALVPAIEKVLSGQKAAMARAMCSPADAGPGK